VAIALVSNKRRVDLAATGDGRLATGQSTKLDWSVWLARAKVALFGVPNSTGIGVKYADGLQGTSIRKPQIRRRAILEASPRFDET